MAKRIFITATNTDIGKTYATKLLLQTYADMGYRVAAFKPIETGVDPLPLDGTALLECMHACNPETKSLHVNDIVPIQYPLPAAPYVASHASAVNLRQLDDALQKIERYADIVLIEGAGGLLVPVDANHMMVDFIEHFNAKALLVSHCRLGCINDTLLNLMLLRQRNIAHEWVLNCRDDDEYFEQVSKPYFDDAFTHFFTLEKDIKALAQALLN